MTDVVSINNGTNLYIEGFEANNYDGSLGLWLISPGRCRDSRNIIDIELILTEDQQYDLNGILVTNQFFGEGGADIASSVNLPNVLYAIYVIADSYGKKPVGSLCSISTYGYVPVLPAGYDSYRLVGYVKSSASGLFNEATANVGTRNDRQVCYLNTQQVSIIPSVTLFEVTLLNVVPCIDNLLATLDVSYKGSSTADIFSMSSVNDSSKAYISIQTQVASTTIDKQCNIVTPLNSLTKIPSFFYKTGATDVLSIVVDKFCYTA